MALRKVKIRRSGITPNLFMGGDREMVMFFALISFALAFSAVELKTTLISIGLWIFSLYIFRKIGKRDPLMRQVYIRYISYSKYYPARPTPFSKRINIK